MKRNIIQIDEYKCNGCGACIPDCPEGALKIIDGKARLVSDLFCDGLGACIGSCPRGAIKIIKREAVPYDEKKVMRRIVKQGKNVIKEHLLHLRDHKQDEYLNQAIEYLNEKGIKNPLDKKDDENMPCGCPGSMEVDNFSDDLDASFDKNIIKLKSALRQWPIQLKLISPDASYFHRKELLIAATCSAYAYANFHQDFLQGKPIIITCPKLDDGLSQYMEKIEGIVQGTQVKKITIVYMEVPCCYQLVQVVEDIVETTNREIEIKNVQIGTDGVVKKIK
jgi:ferredoxin